MTEDRRETLARLASAAMHAILDEFRGEDGASYIDPELSRQAFVVCMASIIEADDRTKTRRDMREAAETVAREIRMQVEALRRRFEATGEHSGWDARSVTKQ